MYHKKFNFSRKSYEREGTDLKITVHGGKSVVIECAESTLLSEAIRRAGFDFPMPCGGNHTCGKCRVAVKGRLSPPGPEEQRLLEGAEKGTRLACFAQGTDGCEVTLPAAEMRVLKGRDLPPGRYDDFPQNALGFAADVGTTTVAVYLYHLHTRRLLASEGAQNSQCAFGADVIARIDYSNGAGPGILQKRILSQMTGMFQACLDRAGAKPGAVTRLTVTGNTTMLHFLTGKDPRGIAAAPFEAESYFGYETAAEAYFPMFPGAALYLPACVQSYVGADITCAMVAVDLREGQLLLDVGTNGEMALCHGGRIFCCAAAAGPAFEGAGISMGMTASPGAVTKVTAQGGLNWETVYGAPARGICGTGIISLLCALRETGALDETGLLVPRGPLAGYVTEGERFVLGDSGVSITQADVRGVQLAKAAIAAGLQTLLHEAGAGEDEIGTLYLCGGFGSLIDVREAAGIGLIPRCLAARAVSAGNGAGTGAAMLLLSSALRRESEALAHRAREIQLSESAFFMEQYIEQMPF